MLWILKKKIKWQYFDADGVYSNACPTKLNQNQNLSLVCCKHKKFPILLKIVRAAIKCNKFLNNVSILRT